MVDAEAFSLGARDAHRGVLLVHGFTGTPYEMRFLGEALAARGYAVEGVKLAGHGHDARDLIRTGWHDWVASAATALDGLRARVGGRQVAVAGLSMGGLVTLELARTHAAAVGAIAVMAAPLWLRPEAISATRAMMRIPMLRRMTLPALAGSDIRDEAYRKKNGEAKGRGGMPIAPLASLIDFGEHVMQRLGDVTQPALLAHSEQDHTVPFDNLDGIAARIGSAHYQKLILHQSFHGITLDVERDKLFAAVADWFDTYLEA